jgi:hypothetical protein
MNEEPVDTNEDDTSEWPPEKEVGAAFRAQDIQDDDDDDGDCDVRANITNKSVDFGA